MEYRTRTQIFEYMRILIEEYVNSEEMEECLSVIDECEKEGRFPPGKWLLHTVDENTKKSRVSLSVAHQELYRDICSFCI
jgi:hypothetical protein